MSNHILKFSAEWCGPCKQLSQEMDKLSGDIEWTELDIDTPEGMGLAKDFGVRGVPTLIFLDENEKEYTRHTGFVSASKIDQLYRAE